MKISLQWIKTYLDFDLTNQEIQTIKNTNLDLKKILEEFSKSPIFKDQIINSKKNVSSMIIYLKKDKNLIQAKKNKFKHNKKLFIDNIYKKINDNYRNAKNEHNIKRHKLINEIRNIINNSNKDYKYLEIGTCDKIYKGKIKNIKIKTLT